MGVISKQKKKIFSVVIITLAACGLFAVNSGIRSNYGIMINAIMENSGVSYSTVSFVLAVTQLMYGITSPVFGIIALKKSSAFVIRCGIILIAIGLLGIPFAKSIWMLMLFLGILLPSGSGALSFGIIMGAITPKLTDKIGPTVSGIVTASSGIGSTIFSPLIQNLLVVSGLMGTMIFLSVPTLILLPISIWMFYDKSKPLKHPEKKLAEKISVLVVFKEAFHSRTYLLVTIAFFTCGFNMTIIETHLYSQIVSCGISKSTAAYAFSIYGIATMTGALLSGVLCSKLQMKNVLSTLYGLRAIAVVLFLITPKTILTVCAFIIVMGMTGNSTVPPTAGIVNKEFGSVRLATLLGFSFFVHQIGSFFSSWLGGISILATRGYTLIWVVDVIFCTIAAILSFMIRDSHKQ